MLINKTCTDTKDGEALELIWTNPNPTSSFTAQTINLPTGFIGFAVEILWGPASVTKIKSGIVCIPFFETPRFYIAASSASSDTVDNGVAPREIKYARDGSISFGNANYYGSTDNSRGVPLRIWGIHFSV